MKAFLKSAAAMALAILMAMSVSAAKEPRLIAANPNAKGAILDADAAPVEFVQAKYPTVSGSVKLDITGITSVKAGKEAQADPVADIEKLVDENAATYGTITVKDGVATLYFQVGSLCNPKRLLVDGIEDDYTLTLSASPNNQYWYDVHIKELSNKDGSRVYEVTTKRDYQYFQVDIITAAETLNVDTLAITGKVTKPVVVEVPVPAKPTTDAAVDTAAAPVVKEADTAEVTTTDAAVDTAPAETGTTDAAVEATVPAEPLVDAAAAEEKLTTSFTYGVKLSGAVR